MHDLSDYDYVIPKELIAQKPASVRDGSRLLILDRSSSEIRITEFKDITDYFEEGDVLVINETKVIPARLYGKSVRNSAEIEILLLKEISDKKWEVMIRPGRKVKIGDTISLPGGSECEITGITEDGGRTAGFKTDNDFYDYIEEHGRVPLPPYIEREADNNDRIRYQTVYANVPGAVAAPTAGLHFTQRIMDDLRKKGVGIVTVLLHVGAGTFKPVKTENISEHRMHREFFSVTEEAAEKINSAKRTGKKIIAVGTTVVRALESAADEYGNVEKRSGETEIFIYPGYRFRVIDRLVTNFHLPKSTLLMLVSAFSSVELVKSAYDAAVKERMRFFSYGDAMLII